MTATDFLSGLVSMLDAAGVPHMLSGSFASAYHGTPRTTQDVDLVIDPSGEEALTRFVSQVSTAGYYVDADHAREALRQRRQFNVIDAASGWKADLIIRKERAFSREEFRRRLPAKVLGVDLFVTSAEDVVLTKLEWAAKTDSDRQLADVEGVVRLKGAALDRAYVERWATDLGGLANLSYRTPSVALVSNHPGRREGVKMRSRTLPMATTTRATEADLLRTPRDGRKYELVDGEIRVSPAGSRHGVVSLKVAARLLAFVSAQKLGHVFESSTGFRLPGGNVRSPDASFVARDRFEGDQPPEGFSPIPPDLAVEVLSPDDRPRAILDKVGEYLEHGVRLVWVIDPRARTATVYRSLSDVGRLGPDDELDGQDVLPGFRCRLGDVLA